MPQPIKTTPTLIEVCNWFDVRMKDLLGEDRTQSIARARHVAMFLLYRHTSMSYPEVARIFDRDHTSVMHGVRRIEIDMLADNRSKVDINELYNSAMAASFPEAAQP